MSDINELVTYLLTPVSQIAIIIALAEVCKRMGVPSKYIPLIDIVLGLLSGLFVYPSLELVPRIIVGLGLGLSACGTFSGIKNVIK